MLRLCARVEQDITRGETTSFELGRGGLTDRREATIVAMYNFDRTPGPRVANGSKSLRTTTTFDCRITTDRTEYYTWKQHKWDGPYLQTNGNPNRSQVCEYSTT